MGEHRVIEDIRPSFFAGTSFFTDALGFLRADGRFIGGKRPKRILRAGGCADRLPREQRIKTGQKVSERNLGSRGPEKTKEL